MLAKRKCGSVCRNGLPRPDFADGLLLIQRAAARLVAAHALVGAQTEQRHKQLLPVDPSGSAHRSEQRLVRPAVGRWLSRCGRRREQSCDQLGGTPLSVGGDRGPIRVSLQ